MRYLYLIAVALLLAGCHPVPLRCRTEYLYPDYLASSRVLTPDPWRECFYGQQIIVTWNLKGGALVDEVRLHLRYGDREMETLIAPITGRHGYKIYRMVNNAYWCKEGVLAYKAELYLRGELVTEWRHHLWAEVIEFEVGEEIEE